jgi:sulfofructose kinase
MPGTENSARDVRPAQARAPRILCAGIIVLDEVFYVENLPPPDGKVEAKEFFIVNGGCAANAAVTVVRLGGRAMLAGPMGSDANGDFVLAALAREKVDCAACQRVPGLATALSAIFIDARGDRTIVTHRDERVAAVIPSDPEALAAAADIVLADNRFPVFVGPICAAARRRGLRIVLDADKRTVVDDPLLRIATHVVFSSECLIATAGCADLAEGLRRVARYTDSFLAVSNGPNDILFLEESLLRRVPVFAIRAVDTLGSRRCVARRVRPGARRRTRRSRGAALCCRRCRIEVHPLGRLRRPADARRSRCVYGATRPGSRGPAQRG